MIASNDSSVFFSGKMIALIREQKVGSFLAFYFMPSVSGPVDLSNKSLQYSNGHISRMNC